MTFLALKDALEALSYCATIIGIPVAIGVFIYQKRKDRVEHEIDTYLRANDKYVQYLSLCLDHPELGFSENSLNEPEVARSGFNLKQLNIFSVLVSMLETGFLLYRYQNSAVRDAQWRGWYKYIEYWASRSDFRDAWEAIGPEFDEDFQAFTNKLISEARTIIRP